MHSVCIRGEKRRKKKLARSSRSTQASQQALEAWWLVNVCSPKVLLAAPHNSKEQGSFPSTIPSSSPRPCLKKTCPHNMLVAQSLSQIPIIRSFHVEAAEAGAQYWAYNMQKAKRLPLYVSFCICYSLLTAMHVLTVW